MTARSLKLWSLKLGRLLSAETVVAASCFAAAAANGELSAERAGNRIIVTSPADPSWKAVMDGNHGGVITELHVPAEGPNLVSNDGNRFEGVCNLIYVDFKQTGKDESGYVAKGSLYYFATTNRLALPEQRADRIAVTAQGSSGNQGQPRADVIKYRQTLTFLRDRIICDGELEWVFDQVAPESRPELIQLNNMFAPGAVSGEMSVSDANTGPVPLPETNSKGRNYPEGINYPLTVEVPLQSGHTLHFRSLQMPDGILKARFYWNEFPRQIENKRGFAFKAWEGWPGNTGVNFGKDEPIRYRYEIVIANPKPTAKSDSK